MTPLEDNRKCGHPLSTGTWTVKDVETVPGSRNYHMKNNKLNQDGKKISIFKYLKCREMKKEANLPLLALFHRTQPMNPSLGEFWGKTDFNF